MEKMIKDPRRVKLPVTELIDLWRMSGHAHRTYDPAVVGTAIVGTAKVIRG